MLSCRHIQKIRLSTNHSVLNYQKWKCLTCNATENIWACLSCSHVYCGKYINEHIKHHASQSSHPLSMSIYDKYIYCYECDAYILNDNAAGDVKILRNCLQAYSPANYKNINDAGSNDNLHDNNNVIVKYKGGIEGNIKKDGDIDKNNIQNVLNNLSPSSPAHNQRRRSFRVQKSNNSQNNDVNNNSDIFSYNIKTQMASIPSDTSTYFSNSSFTKVCTRREVADEHTELWFRRYYLLSHCFKKWRKKCNFIQPESSDENEKSQLDVVKNKTLKEPSKSKKRTRNLSIVSTSSSSSSLYSSQFSSSTIYTPLSSTKSKSSHKPHSFSLQNSSKLPSASVSKQSTRLKTSTKSQPPSSSPIEKSSRPSRQPTSKPPTKYTSYQPPISSQPQRPPSSSQSITICPPSTRQIALKKNKLPSQSTTKSLKPTKSLKVPQLSAKPLPTPPSQKSKASRSKKRLVGAVGLANLGNTCYMNSILQVLHHLSPFSQLFLQGNGFRDEQDQEGDKDGDRNANINPNINKRNNENNDSSHFLKEASRGKTKTHNNTNDRKSQWDRNNNDSLDDKLHQGTNDLNEKANQLRNNNLNNDSNKSILKKDCFVYVKNEDVQENNKKNKFDKKKKEEDDDDDDDTDNDYVEKACMSNGKFNGVGDVVVNGVSNDLGNGVDNGADNKVGKRMGDGVCEDVVNGMDALQFSNKVVNRVDDGGGGDDGRRECVRSGQSNVLQSNFIPILDMFKSATKSASTISKTSLIKSKRSSISPPKTASTTTLDTTKNSRSYQNHKTVEIKTSSSSFPSSSQTSFPHMMPIKTSTSALSSSTLKDSVVGDVCNGNGVLSTDEYDVIDTNNNSRNNINNSSGNPNSSKTNAYPGKDLLPRTTSRMNVNGNGLGGENTVSNGGCGSSNGSKMIDQSSVAGRMKERRRRKAPSKLSLSQELNSLLRLMWSGDMSMLSPHKMLYAVWNVIPFFKGYSQQDAQEFLSEFLDKVQSEMDRASMQRKTNNHTSKHTNLDKHSCNAGNNNNMQNIKRKTINISSTNDNEACNGFHDDDDDDDVTINKDNDNIGNNNVTVSGDDNGLVKGTTKCNGGNNHDDDDDNGNENGNGFNDNETNGYDDKSDGDKVVNKNEDLVTQLFQGELFSQVRCLSCGHESGRREAFMDLSLEFPLRFHARSSLRNNNHKLEKTCQLEEMLGRFMEVERLEGKIYACEQCNNQKNETEEKVEITTTLTDTTNTLSSIISDIKSSNLPNQINTTSNTSNSTSNTTSNTNTNSNTTSSTNSNTTTKTNVDRVYSEVEKWFRLSKLPSVLRLHLKRFMWSGKSSRGKIMVGVTFPHLLNLTPYCHHPSSTQLYTLSSVVVHHGRGFGSGHYTAYCWNYDADSWLHCNDAKMHRVTAAEVHQTQAYILVYTKNNAHLSNHLTDQSGVQNASSVSSVEKNTKNRSKMTSKSSSKNASNNSFKNTSKSNSKGTESKNEFVQNSIPHSGFSPKSSNSSSTIHLSTKQLETAKTPNNHDTFHHNSSNHNSSSHDSPISNSTILMSDSPLSSSRSNGVPKGRVTGLKSQGIEGNNDRGVKRKIQFNNSKNSSKINKKNKSTKRETVNYAAKVEEGSGNKIEYSKRSKCDKGLKHCQEGGGLDEKGSGDGVRVDKIQNGKAVHHRIDKNGLSKNSYKCDNSKAVRNDNVYGKLNSDSIDNAVIISEEGNGCSSGLITRFKEIRKGNGAMHHFKRSKTNVW